MTKQSVSKCSRPLQWLKNKDNSTRKATSLLVCSDKLQLDGKKLFLYLVMDYVATSSFYWGIHLEPRPLFISLGVNQSISQWVSQWASQWSVRVAVLTGGVVGLMRPPHLLQPQHPHLGCLHNRRSFQSLALCSTHSPTNRNNLCTELEICISCWWWSLRYSQPLSLFLLQFDLDASEVKPSHGI